MSALHVSFGEASEGNILVVAAIVRNLDNQSVTKLATIRRDVFGDRGRARARPESVQWLMAKAVELTRKDGSTLWAFQGAQDEFAEGIAAWSPPTILLGAIEGSGPDADLAHSAAQLARDAATGRRQHDFARFGWCAGSPVELPSGRLFEFRAELPRMREVTFRSTPIESDPREARKAFNAHRFPWGDPED